MQWICKGVSHNQMKTFCGRLLVCALGDFLLDFKVITSRSPCHSTPTAPGDCPEFVEETAFMKSLKRLGDLVCPHAEGSCSHTVYNAVIEFCFYHSMRKLSSKDLVAGTLANAGISTDIHCDETGFRLVFGDSSSKMTCIQGLLLPGGIRKIFKSVVVGTLHESVLIHAAP